MFSVILLGKEARISWEDQSLKFTGDLEFLLILGLSAAGKAGVSSAASWAWATVPGLCQSSWAGTGKSVHTPVERLVPWPGAGAAGAVPGRNSACLQSHTQLGVRVCCPEASGTGFRAEARALLRAQ